MGLPDIGERANADTLWGKKIRSRGREIRKRERKKEIRGKIKVKWKVEMQTVCERGEGRDKAKNPIEE
jgi:hypothetical protein